MLSKIFTKALRPAVNQAMLKNKQVTMALFKSMSTANVARVDKGKQKLFKAISREIKFEEENYQKDESVSKFLESNGFSLKDSETINTVELSKKVGNLSVQVVFQSRPPQFNDEEEEGEDGQQNIQKQQGQEDEAMDQNEQNFCDFTVYVLQPNNKALTFECTSFDSEININFVSVVSDVEHHKLNSGFNRPSAYSADFSILDERLQTGFLEYLKGLGVNEDVALFVEHYSQDKDQRQYMQWLKDVNEFVEKPLE